jgi:saccharopine dehydrogenase-like NADP-dependent oxidoreductase
LADTLRGRVRNLNYRTIRYPGHCAILRTLINDLKLGQRFDLLRDIFVNAVPAIRTRSCHRDRAQGW